MLTVELLEEIGSIGRGIKRKRGSTSLEAMKQQNTSLALEIDNSEELFNESDDAEDTDESEFQGFSDTSHAPPSPEPLSASYGKYIPPAARKSQTNVLPAKKEDPRLRKQIQGILNRYFLDA